MLTFKLMLDIYFDRLIFSLRPMISISDI